MRYRQTDLTQDNSVGMGRRLTSLQPTIFVGPHLVLLVLRVTGLPPPRLDVLRVRQSLLDKLVFDSYPQGSLLLELQL
jgi:hypothetical protein